MDSLSSRITFRTKVVTSREHIKKLDKDDDTLLFWIEGDLEIIINNRVFFSQYINMPEFYVQLKNWLLKNNNKKDFGYNSIDYEGDRPILEFKMTSKGIQVYSIWQEFSYEISFDKNELLQKLSALCDSIHQDIKCSYDVDVNQFLDFYK